jgi:hypothetical protein
MRAPATIAIVTATTVCAVLAGHIGEADAGCRHPARPTHVHVVAHYSAPGVRSASQCR